MFNFKEFDFEFLIHPYLYVYTVIENIVFSIIIFGNLSIPPKIYVGI
jgi:hypothetical protein